MIDPGMEASCAACGMHLILLSHDCFRHGSQLCCLWDASDWLSQCLIQAEWERSRKELDKGRHDVERLRRALDRSDVEKRDQQHKATAVTQALQVEKERNENEKKRLRLSASI